MLCESQESHGSFLLDTGEWLGVLLGYMSFQGTPDDRIKQLLEQAGMRLVRSKKHQVWHHPDGRTFTMSSTPSDNNAKRQALRSLERFLGLRAKADKGAHS
jgi:predicted RNA binding protein YcfA (HicA-like mRNA interferase family)